MVDAAVEFKEKLRVGGWVLPQGATGVITRILEPDECIVKMDTIKIGREEVQVGLIRTRFDQVTIRGNPIDTQENEVLFETENQACSQYSTEQTQALEKEYEAKLQAERN